MKAKVSKKYFVLIAVLTAAATTVALTSCHNGGSAPQTETTSATSQAVTQADTQADSTASAASTTDTAAVAAKKLAESDIKINDTVTNEADGENQRHRHQ